MKKLEELLSSTPEKIEFDRVMQIIEENYNYTPTRFTNGHGDMQVINEAGSNEGSCIRPIKQSQRKTNTGLLR